MYTDIYGREHRYAPPLGYVQKDGTVHFCAAGEWAAMIERGLSFPEYRGPSSLRYIRGDCLEPLITSQHMIRTRPAAPDEQLIDGAFYSIALGASAQNSEAAAYREKWGMAPGENFEIVKCVRWIGSGWYAQCKDSISRLSEYGAVLAKVVAVLPPTGCAPNAAAHAPQIGANAATVISQFSASGSFGAGPWTGTTATFSSGIGLSMPAVSIDISAIFTVTMMSKQISGTGAYLTIGETSGGIPTTVSTIQNLLTATNTPYTMQCQFVVLANTAQNFAIMWGGGNAGTNQVTGDSLTIQVEYIKR
jgi:hypothetical protein